MKLTRFLLFFCIPVIGIGMTSCLGGNNENDYSQWRIENTKYIENAEIEMVDGHLRYEKIVPAWDKSIYALMEWHNDRNATLSQLTPLSNSTIDVKYVLRNIEGDTLDSSASYRLKPNQMITGFWTAVTHMHVGDSVTAIMPYSAGYGEYSSGKVLPYSTLIFDIRLDSIVAYEKPSWR